MNKIPDSKVRFSDRVADYKKFRPDYPEGVIRFLRENCPVRENWSVADIGSGTGISTKLLLDGLKCNVYAVEPNADMRKASEEFLSAYPGFYSVNGCAENTNLPNKSIDMVSAFHWFNKEETRIEFARILKEAGWVLLVWNDRLTTGTHFLEAYEELLRGMPEYSKINHKNISADIIADFLGDKNIKTVCFQKFQQFDFEGVKGRLFSSSYSPREGTAERTVVISKLEELFNKFSSNGKVRFEYRTNLYLGRLISRGNTQ